jgi:hypothetical protein
MWNESDESAFGDWGLDSVSGWGNLLCYSWLKDSFWMGLCLVSKYVRRLDSSSVSVRFTGESTRGCLLPVPAFIGSNRSDSVLIANGMGAVDINPKSRNKRVPVFVFNGFLWIIAHCKRCEVCKLLSVSGDWSSRLNFIHKNQSTCNYWPLTSLKQERV